MAPLRFCHAYDFIFIKLTGFVAVKFVKENADGPVTFVSRLASISRAMRALDSYNEMYSSTKAFLLNARASTEMLVVVVWSPKT